MLGADDIDGLLAVAALAADRIVRRRDGPVSTETNADELQLAVEMMDFSSARPMDAAAEELLNLLQRHAVRSDHPRYFGLFNPPTLAAAAAGELVAAVINPQLAVWSHAPAAAEIEAKLVELFTNTIWKQKNAGGTFTSGGTEANHSALLVALAKRYPDWSRDGVPRSGKRPAIYASAESHLAWIKLARAAGLGSDAVRLVPTSDGLSLDGEALAAAISADHDRDPVLVVATAGTTAHGAVDDLAGLAEVGHRFGSHVHVDAAWAGALLIDPERRHLLSGIELAHSATIDPHKWLAVPMGTGLFLVNDKELLRQPFSVSTGYMPSNTPERLDPYIHSLQWSRRFNGAKLFMALATLGLDGYRKMFRQQFAMGERLRTSLKAHGWIISNDTALPLVCFAPKETSDDTVRRIEAAVVSSGKAWISAVRLRGSLALRACVTSFETDDRDVDALVELLETVRASAANVNA